MGQFFPAYTYTYSTRVTTYAICVYLKEYPSVYPLLDDDNSHPRLVILAEVAEARGELRDLVVYVPQISVPYSVSEYNYLLRKDMVNL